MNPKAEEVKCKENFQENLCTRVLSKISFFQRKWMNLGSRVVQRFRALHLRSGWGPIRMSVVWSQHLLFWMLEKWSNYTLYFSHHLTIDGVDHLIALEANHPPSAFIPLLLPVPPSFFTALAISYLIRWHIVY